MKTNRALISLFLIFLISPYVAAIEVQPIYVKTTSPLTETSTVTTQVLNQQDKTHKDNSADGTTSASQLRAKKSHYVSKKNETILSVSLGLISIGIIIFFVKILGGKK